MLRITRRPIPNYPGYYAGTDGHIWSRKTGVWRRLSELITGGDVYPMVRLYCGRTYNRRVYRLVARAFLGPRPTGLQVRHVNDDKSDNRPSNLRYGTGKQNAADRERNGLQARGEDDGNAKVRTEDVLRMRQRVDAGETRTSVAADYRLSVAQVSRIVSRRHWAHVA